MVRSAIVRNRSASVSSSAATSPHDRMGCAADENCCGPAARVPACAGRATQRDCPKPLPKEIVMSVTSRGALSALAAFALLAGLSSGIASAQVVVARGAMPAPIVEVVPAAPGAGYAWVPGHHVWRGGGWFWVKGHYVRGVVPAMP